MYMLPKQVNLAIVPSQVMPGAVVAAISKMAAISETKRRRTFNFDCIYIGFVRRRFKKKA